MDLLVTSTGVKQIDAGDFNNSLANPQEIFFDAFAQVKNDSGVSVTPTTALTYSSVWQAVQIIAGDVARVRFNVYERANDDSRVIKRRHPAYTLLNKRSNPYLSGYYLRETLTAHALLWGNGYAKIIRSNTGAPIALELLQPDQVTPERLQDGRVVYHVRIAQNKTDTLAYDDVLHLKGLGFDGLKGHSVVTLARNSFGLGMAAEKHGARHFKQGARPNVILKHPQRLDKDQADQLLESFEKRHGGSENVGRPALAAGGLEIVPLSMSNSDSQWLESRQFQRVEIASWFSLPPHKLGDSSRIAYNSIEAEERSYVNQTLMRWFERWEHEVDAKLLTERQYMSDWYTEHDVETLIQGDMQTQTATAVSLRNAMIITQNEARSRFNLPNVDGGDSFENSATSSNQAPPPDNPPSNARALQACRQMIQERISQFVRTEINQVVKIAGRAKNVATSLENFYGEFQNKFAAGLRPCIDTWDALREHETSEDRVSDLVGEHCSQSLQELIETLQNGTPPEMLGDEVKEVTRNWDETKPRQLAAMICGECDEQV